jgi:dienelactone hydrolase
MKVLLLLILGLFSIGYSQAEMTTRPQIESRSIEYKHDDMVLEGFLAYDANVTEKRPGILVVHEWWGHNDYAKQRATELAELGFIAFALDMYGKGVVTSNPQKASELAGQFYQDRQLMRDRAAAGLEVLKKQDFTDTNNLAVIGFCFGGTTALELARSGADIDGCVSFHGGLNTPNTEDAKNIKASVLVLHGADDPYVKTEEVLAFQDEMRKAGVDWQMHYYSGAVHSFTNPAAGSDNSQGAAYNETAAKRSWKDMQVFFKDILN